MIDKYQELEQKTAILQKLKGISQEMEKLTSMPGYQEVLNLTAEIGIGVVPESELDLTDIKFGVGKTRDIVAEEVNTLRKML